MIPAELVTFLQSGLSAIVGTCGTSLRPVSCRAVGVVVHEGCERVTLFVPEATGQRTIANLRENAQIALTLSKPMTHRTVQVKGRVTALRKALAAERAMVESYVEAFGECVDAVGMPRARVRGMATWPAWAIEFSVEQLFTQTPGPRAGQPLCPEADRDA